jgi:monoterpene epsilon-lactone hydrolase
MSDANGGVEERSAVTERVQTSSRLSGLSRRSGTSAPQSLSDLRQAIEQQSLGEVAAGVAVRGQSYGGVWCLECAPAEARSTTLYLHGGGFRMCSPEVYAPFVSRLARRCRTRVIVPRYGLAPEEPFPAALLDAVEVYLEVASRYGPLVVGGDSAGGGLAVAMTLATDVKVDAPVGLALLSPWVDLSLSGDSYRSRGDRDQRFSLSAAREAADSYLGGFAASDPLVSPIFGNLNDLPSSVVLVGTEEVLFDDSRRLVDLINQNKGSADLHIFPGMQHVWPVAEPELPESHRAMEIVASFYDRIEASSRRSN